MNNLEFIFYIELLSELISSDISEAIQWFTNALYVLWLLILQITYFLKGKKDIQTFIKTH